VQLLKECFLISTVTAALNGLPCSHIRSVLIYNAALAGNCIFYGVVPIGTDLSKRYDT